MAKQPPPPEEYPFIYTTVDCHGLHDNCQQGIKAVMATSYEEALLKLHKSIRIYVDYNPYDDEGYDILPSGSYVVTGMHIGHVILNYDEHRLTISKFLDLLNETWCNEDTGTESRLYPCLLEGQETPPIYIKRQISIKQK